MSYAPLSDNSDRGQGHRIQVPNGDEHDRESSSSSRPTRSTSASHDPAGGLSQPLTGSGDEEAGEDADPFYVFRADLYRKLELVDESLAEYLRVVHQTVSQIQYSSSHRAVNRMGVYDTYPMKDAVLLSHFLSFRLA
jgi:hypothetical protein